MTTDKWVLRIVDEIYSSLDDFSNWIVPLSLLREFSECNAVTFDVFSLSPQSVQYTISLGLDTEIDNKYLANYAEYDCKVERAASRANSGVYSDRDLLTTAELKASSAYNELWIPNQLGNQLHCFSTIDNNLAIAISLMTGDQLEPFSRQTIEVCEALLPHFARAVRLQSDITNAKIVRSAKSEVLQGLSQGIVMVDENNNTVYLNQAAENICDENDGLYFAASEFSIRSRDQHQELRKIIHNIVSSQQMPANHTLSKSMYIMRPSGKRPYIIEVTPVSFRGVSFGPKNPCAILRITDTEHRPVTRPEILKQLFGLTPAEIKLAELLTTGMPLNEISECAQIAIGTVRNQLKSIFQKTQTKSQGQLISLLHSVL